MQGQLSYLHKKGVKIIIAIPQDQTFYRKIIDENPGIEVVSLNIQRSVSLKNDFKSFFSLIKILQKNKPDIVHLHTPKASFLGVIASKLLNHKVIIYHMHGLISTNGNRLNKQGMYYVEKITCFFATQIIAVSISLKELAVTNDLCESNKITVLKNGTINGIDYKNRFNPEIIRKDKKKFLTIEANHFVIGFVGRLHQDKGIDDYFNVIKSLINQKLNVVGLVIGPDETSGKLDGMLRHYNLIVGRDIHILGQKLSPENYMVYFDILLFPTKREGFGLVAAEANALKVPVIGYDIPGLRDAVINHQTGILVDYQNVEELSEAVKSYYFSPILLSNHGENGRNRVIRDFDPESVWQAILNKYHILLKEKGIEI